MAGRSRIGLGLVGAGRMGSALARFVVREVADADLVAIADIMPASRERLAGELGVGTLHETAAELAADRRVDAIIVATSSSQHVDAVRAAAAAGRDVFCEKPLALTLAETDAALEAVAAAGVRLQVGFMRRFDADYRRAHDRVVAGAVGRPLLFSSLQFDPEPPPPAFCDPAVSGGIYVDMGIHEFDLARWFLADEPVEVQAIASASAFPELAAVGDFDRGVATVRFAQGALAVVQLGRSAVYGEDVRSELLGEHGSVFVGTLPTSRGAFGSRDGIALDAADPTRLRFESAYAAELRSFVAAIRSDRPVETDGNDAREALRLALAADRAARTGRPVALADRGG